jgi:hypothetical protein
MGREIESRLSIGRQLFKKGSHVGVIAGCRVGTEVVEVWVRRQVGRHHRQSGGRAEMAPWVHLMNQFWPEFTGKT